MTRQVNVRLGQVHLALLDELAEEIEKRGGKNNRTDVIEAAIYSYAEKILGEEKTGEIVTKNFGKKYDVMEALKETQKKLEEKVEKEHGANVDLRKKFGLDIHELRLFAKVHKSFYIAQGTEEKKNYSIDKITKIRRNFKENALAVHFENGDWFNFYTDGTWG